MNDIQRQAGKFAYLWFKRIYYLLALIFVIYTIWNTTDTNQIFSITTMYEIAIVFSIWDFIGSNGSLSDSQSRQMLFAFRMSMFATIISVALFLIGPRIDGFQQLLSINLVLIVIQIAITLVTIASTWYNVKRLTWGDDTLLLVQQVSEHTDQVMLNEKVDSERRERQQRSATRKAILNDPNSKKSRRKRVQNKGKKR